FELRTGELKVLEGLRRLEEKAVSTPKKAEKETFHIEFGRELYNKVFSGKLGEHFKNCFEDAQKSGAGIRICLRFDESAQEIAALPWEFLHDGKDFFVTNRNTLISRLPSDINKVKSSPLESILRMLVVISSPNDPRVAPLNTELEQEVILEAVDKLQREHKMEVDFTEDATFETIEGYLNEKDYHIVHFTGHGTFNDEKNKGYLILETEDGKAREMDNGAISDLLAGRNVRLVVLSACQSGKTSNKEAYADLASHLARKNIPAVVAMQYSILDLSATKFASIFYQALINKPVDLALTEARIVMKNAERSNGVDFATPVLYLSDPDCLSVSKIKPEAPEIFNKPTMLGEVAVMKKGFVGRRRELRLLQKDFMSDIKRAAIIYGFGGLGKTVLATRLALRMNQYFEGMFAMRCRAATRPEDILNELNAFLLLAGIQQLNQVLYQPVPLKVKTAALAGILNQRRFLIILDNFEDCLDETRGIIASPELKDFIQHILNNTITNTKFIITTRYNFDPLEGRLTGSIEHISLPELPFPETLWLMNNYKELANLEAEKKRKIYKAIGGHPWTIGQFVKHAAVQGVDNLLLDLSKLKREQINFTLLDKSYLKLDEKAKELLLRASIYQEAVPVEALSWIIGDEGQPSPPVSEALAKLINWGLIAKPEAEKETFYAMHTLVREFAGQELEKEKLERKKLLIRAAQYYENLIKTTKNLWDILKAREYYYQAEEWEKANGIVASTYDYLVRWGYVERAINLLNQSIGTTSGITKTIAMANLAIILHGLGEWRTAVNLFTEVKNIFEKEGQKNNVAATLHNLGNTHVAQGNYEEAVDLYQQSLKINEELGDKSGIAHTLHQLGVIHQKQGNYEEAVKLYKQSLKIEEELGNKSDIAKTLHQLGIIHEKQGNYEEAVDLYQQSLKINEELGDKSGIAYSLGQLGKLHYKQGNYKEAVELYQQCMKISNELGDKAGIAKSLALLGGIHEEKDKDYISALEKYLIALSIFKELNSPDSKVTENYINRLKEQMGEIAFNKALQEFRRRHGS
ncbi:MAG: tetratricopeptide repeat protein, partial [Candidatus Methanoperedens sp.]